MEQKSLNLQQKACRPIMTSTACARSLPLTRRSTAWASRARRSSKFPRNEYNYKVKNTHLQRESLRHDFCRHRHPQRPHFRNDRERERKKYERACERLGNLVVKAPVAGQLSFVKVTPGQQAFPAKALQKSRCCKIIKCILP